LTFRESVGRFKSNDKFIQNRLFNRLGGQALRYILAHRLAARNRRLAGIPRDEREQRLLDEGILVIENFLPPDIFEKVKAEMPAPTRIRACARRGRTCKASSSTMRTSPQRPTPSPPSASPKRTRCVG
jgi:hypothetical protein